MRKKSHLFVLAVMIMFVGLIMTDSSAEYVCGDANNDGTLNVSDAVYIINHVFVGGPAPDSTCCETGCPPTMTDIDGNTYFTIKIGDQCWMAENLAVTHYRNGEPIPNVTGGTTWGSTYTGAYCNYDNNESYVATCGRLYNWYAVADSRNIAPEGWHVPTDDEWKQLEMYLGMSQAEADGTGYRGTDEGGKLKETGIVHWADPNAGATNESGFTAVPGGWRNIGGYFSHILYFGWFWSSTQNGSYTAWSRRLSYGHAQIVRDSDDQTRFGLSVRCVKDQ